LPIAVGSLADPLPEGEAVVDSGDRSHAARTITSVAASRAQMAVRTRGGYRKRASVRIGGSYAQQSALLRTGASAYAKNSQH
jgi:hypothetical protein